MSHRILYVAATSSEAEILLKIKGITPVNGGFRFGSNQISVLIAGVGSMATAWAMKQWFYENGKPDLAINAGIAGSYSNEVEIGDVVIVRSDCFADAGIEDGDVFLTLAEAGLAGYNDFPFNNSEIYSDKKYIILMDGILKSVRAITVNTATGSESTIKKLKNKYNPDIETMEGATFFYICARENISFLALRAISNRVEPRNRSNWNIALALENLSEKLNEFIIRL